MMLQDAQKAAAVPHEEQRDAAGSVLQTARIAQGQLANAKESIRELSSKIAAAGLHAAYGEEAAKLGTSAELLGKRLEIAQELVVGSRRTLMLNILAAKEAKRMEAAIAIRKMAVARGHQADALFDVISSGRESISKANLQDYLVSSCSFGEAASLVESLTTETGALDQGGPQVITREDLERLLRVYYRVVRMFALSSKLAIQESKQIRRLEEGEIVELLDGPQNDPGVSIVRARVRTLKGNDTGWATVTGKKGVAFMNPGGTALRVTTRSVLSPDPVGDQGGMGLGERMLQDGEPLELLGWTKTANGATRLCVKAQEDSTVGWTTLAFGGGLPSIQPVV